MKTTKSLLEHLRDSGVAIDFDKLSPEEKQAVKDKGTDCVLKCVNKNGRIVGVLFMADGKAYVSLVPGHVNQYNLYK